MQLPLQADCLRREKSLTKCENCKDLEIRLKQREELQRRNMDSAQAVAIELNAEIDAWKKRALEAEARADRLQSKVMSLDP